MKSQDLNFLLIKGGVESSSLESVRKTKSSERKFSSIGRERERKKEEKINRKVLKG